MEKNKILYIGLFASLAFLIPSLFQNVYAQSSATVEVFGTGNASDDNCNTIVQSGSVIFLGCYASASTTLRINAVTGNSTIATATLANSQGSKFYLSGSNEIVLLDALNNSMKKYQLSGATITNTATTTLTGCSEEQRYLSQATATQLVISCTDGTQRLFNMNTMTVDASWSTTIQGACANPNQVFMQAGSITKGVVSCDSTEVYLFTVSGGTITFTDSLTGWNSGAARHLISGNSVYRWVDSGSSLQVASIDTSTWTFTSGLTDFPTQSDVTDMIVQFGFSLSMDGTSDNILYYLTSAEQPSPAVANFSSALFDFGTGWDFGELRASSDNLSLLVASSVTDAGRYYIISDIIIDGNPVDDVPPDNDPFDTGIDCSLPANSSKLICRLPTGGITTNLGNATGREITELTCQVIFQTCEDTDPKTNGMGLLYFIGSLFVVVGMFYYVLGTERVANIPLFIWIIIVIALSAYFTLGGWINPVFLIISIVAVIALAAPTLINKIGGKDSGFGGGSTE